MIELSRINQQKKKNNNFQVRQAKRDEFNAFNEPGKDFNR